MTSKGYEEAAHSEPPPRASAAPPPPPAARVGGRCRSCGAPGECRSDELCCAACNHEPAPYDLTADEIGRVCALVAKRLLDMTEDERTLERDGKKLIPMARIVLSGTAAAFSVLAIAIAENPNDFGQAVSDALDKVSEALPLTYVVLDQ